MGSRVNYVNTGIKLDNNHNKQYHFKLEHDCDEGQVGDLIMHFLKQWLYNRLPHATSQFQSEKCFMLNDKTVTIPKQILLKMCKKDTKKQQKNLTCIFSV